LRRFCASVQGNRFLPSQGQWQQRHPRSGGRLMGRIAARLASQAVQALPRRWVRRTSRFRGYRRSPCQCPDRHRRPNHPARRRLRGNERCCPCPACGQHGPAGPETVSQSGSISKRCSVLFGRGRFGRMRSWPWRRRSSSRPGGRAIRRSGRRGPRGGGRRLFKAADYARSTRGAGPRLHRLRFLVRSLGGDVVAIGE
jgi:hypothetical protein